MLITNLFAQAACLLLGIAAARTGVAGADMAASEDGSDTDRSVITSA